MPLENWHYMRIAVLSDKGFSAAEIAENIGLEEEEVAEYLLERSKRAPSKKKKTYRSSSSMRGDNVAIGSSRSDTPMSRMLKMMEEQAQMKILERMISGNNGGGGGGFDIGEMMKMTMMMNLMEKTNKTSSDSMMPLMLMALRDNKGNNGMDFQMMKSIMDNKGDDKWLKMMEIQMQDRNQNTKMDQFKDFMAERDKHEKERMALQEKIREVEHTAYTDKIKDLVNQKGQKEGWSGEAMQTIQTLVTEDLITKFKKGMEATSPEKGATETILESLGSVLQAAEPMLRPMAAAAADSIKEKGIRQTIDSRTGQQPVQQQPESNVRQAMDQQVMQRQSGQQAQGQDNQQPVDKPVDDLSMPNVPPLDFDEDYDLMRSRPQQR